MSDPDAQLLDRYARARDESAFAELVRRHLNLVYSAAARRVGDRHLAEDVTQAVFLILARKPRAARAASPLSAWLLTTVRYAAANAMKIERRRRRHESAAATNASGACSPNPSDVLVWHEVAAHIDDALLRLPPLDRQAVLLRYFEGKPVRDIADAMNTTEGAARQRLSRSLEKLRHRLTRHSTAIAIDGAAGLATLLAAHALRAAPPRLTASACSAAAAAATTATGTASFTIAKGAIAMMTLTKLKTVAAVAAVASLLTTGLFITINRGAHAQDSQRAAVGNRDAGLRELAAARVQAAQELLATLDQRERAGDPMTSDFVDLKMTTLRRLVDARIDAADGHAARLRAAEQYVQQCRDLLGILKQRLGNDVTRVGIAQGAYQLADAEYLLAKLHGMP
jgi:RNA polymerase sigma factor (sigma-70 family)